MMTKLITIPKFVEATGLPYRLCPNQVKTQTESGLLPSDAVTGSMCAGWSNGLASGGYRPDRGRARRNRG
jgi:hypothetical protein